MIEEQNVKKARSPVPKAFAGIYYSVLAVVAALLLIFSFVTYFYAPASMNTSVNAAEVHDSYAKVLAADERNTFTEGTGTTADAAVTKIDGWLSQIDGLTRVNARKAVQTATNTGTQQKVTATLSAGATYTLMDLSQSDIDFNLDADTVADMSADASKEDLVYAARQVKNFVVVIPAAEHSATTQAALFMTHYDSNAGSVGASSAAAVAAMIGTIDKLVESNATFTNDLVFVITEGRYEHSVGAYAFKNQFVGFDDVYSRVGAAFNFDALTAGGALTMVQTSDADSGIVAGYLASGASVRTDSSVAALMDEQIASDFDIFRDKVNDDFAVPCLNFMTTAGAYDAGTAYDDLNNVSADVTAQYASAMESLAKYFGNADITAKGLETPADGATYTYLGMSAGTRGAVVYVLAALLLLLLAGNIVLAAKKKTFGVQNAFKGMGGVALTLAVSLAAFFAVYFIIGLLSVAFGAITMEMLVTAHLLDAAVLVPAILFAAAVSCGLYPAVKRAFKIKAADCVRGGAILQMLVAICFGFIFPPAALPFLIIGLANGAVMLLSSLLKKVFKNKFGFGVERLFLYTLPAMFGLPFLIQATLTINNLFPVVTLPFLLLAFSLLLAAITPYFDYLQPVLTDAFEKLPKHVVPVVETIVEEREDPAKKGKFETVTETKVVKHKVAWQYHNWFGVTVLTVLTIIALLVLAPVGATVNTSPGRNMTTDYDYTYSLATDALYDNAVVCYVDGSVSSTSRFSWLVKDEAVYQTLRYLDGYDYWEWTRDDKFGAYKKTVSAASMPAAADLFAKESVDGGYEIKVSPTYATASQVKMKINGIKAGDKVTVSKDESSDAEFTLTFDAPADYIDFVLPFGYGKCTVKVETSSSSLIVTGYEYYDARTDIPGMFGDAYTEYYRMAKFFSDQGKTLKAAFVLYDSV